MHSRLLRVHLFTSDSLASIFNKISKRWPRLQATWLIMIGFLKFELYGLSCLSLSFHSSWKLWAYFSSHGQGKLAWGLKPEKPKRRYEWSWLMSIATTYLDIMKIKGSALRTLHPSNVYNRPFLHSTPVSKHKEMRSRLGWTISYKSLYFVHPSLDLIPLFTGMRERSATFL